MRSNFVSSFAAVLTLLAWSSHAHADDTAAAAEALFTEAKALMREGKYAEACPKFAESQRLDAGTGTLLALALCYEKDGKTASAWATYRSVIAAARQAQQTDREKIAAERAAALEPKLAYLTIAVAQENRTNDSLAVARDGVNVNSASFGVAVPVDPGEHVIRATANGKEPVELRVTVKETERVTLDVPELANAALSPSEPAPLDTSRTYSEETKSRSKLPAYIAFGVGAVGLGVGTVFGIGAIGASNESKDLCSAAACIDRSAAVSRHDSAVTQAWISNVGLLVGGIGAVTGAVLLLTARDASPAPPSSARLRLTPTLGPTRGGGSFGLSGTF